MIDNLELYVAGVEAAVTRDDKAEDTAAEVARLNQELIASGFRLPEEFRNQVAGAPYTRNLVHLDPGKRFAVIAIIWGPFQQTEIHDHLNWGVVSVLEGSCLELEYDRIDDGSDAKYAELSVRAASLADTGTVSALTPPPHSNIHAMSNGMRTAAITLHTYGDLATRARLYDAVTGKVEIRELVFHNR